jgi:alkylated DNA repair dioxygenase AlkB
MVTQSSLFTSQIEQIELPDGGCSFIREYLPENKAWALYEHILEHTQWTQDTLTLYGKTHLAPRMSCWMADAELSYRYSNLTLQPTPWLPQLKELTHLVSTTSGIQFNSVLINHYRDGQDSNGWHADNEPELGPDPIVASLSLGAVRDFRLRHIESKQTLTVPLTHGSLFIMFEGMQTHWQHTIPKRAKAESRINLTFRKIVTQ